MPGDGGKKTTFAIPRYLVHRKFDLFDICIEASRTAQIIDSQFTNYISQAGQMICMICMIELMSPGGSRIVCMICGRTCVLGWICTVQILHGIS